jgi:hypothetical protein
MRIALCLLALVSLTACAVAPPRAWTFDPTQPPPKAKLPMAELVVLTDRVAQLQLRRNEVRTRIAAEPDAWRRQALYADLHGVGMELSPLERRLAGLSAAR